MKQNGKALERKKRLINKQQTPRVERRKYLPPFPHSPFPPKRLIVTPPIDIVRRVKNYSIYKRYFPPTETLLNSFRFLPFEWSLSFPESCQHVSIIKSNSTDGTWKFTFLLLDRGRIVKRRKKANYGSKRSGMEERERRREGNYVSSHSWLPREPRIMIVKR